MCKIISLSRIKIVMSESVHDYGPHQQDKISNTFYLSAAAILQAINNKYQ